MSIQASMIMLF
jgi:hypothetical protein